MLAPVRALCKHRRVSPVAAEPRGAKEPTRGCAGSWRQKPLQPRSLRQSWSLDQTWRCLPQLEVGPPGDAAFTRQPRSQPVCVAPGHRDALMCFLPSLEALQMQGAKMAEVDDADVDSDGICLSDRGPGELLPTREELGLAKPGLALMDHNGQVTRCGSGGRAPSAAPAAPQGTRPTATCFPPCPAAWRARSKGRQAGWPHFLSITPHSTAPACTEPGSATCSDSPADHPEHSSRTGR